MFRKDTGANGSNMIKELSKAVKQFLQVVEGKDFINISYVASSSNLLFIHACREVKDVILSGE